MNISTRFEPILFGSLNDCSNLYTTIITYNDALLWWIHLLGTHDGLLCYLFSFQCMRNPSSYLSLHLTSSHMYKISFPNWQFNEYPWIRPHSYVRAWYIFGVTLDWYLQCDQIVRILKLMSTYFLTKVAQIFGDFWGYFGKHFLYVKTDVANFWSSLGYILFQHLVTLIGRCRKVVFVSLSIYLIRFWVFTLQKGKHNGEIR